MLGVLFGSNLSFERHVSGICKTTFFHLKNICKLHHMLSLTNAEQLVHAFMTSSPCMVNKQTTAGPKHSSSQEV